MWTNLFKKPENLPRLYADLMFRAESQYAPWNPSEEIKVGDVGKITRTSGEFLKYGNIYDSEYDDLRNELQIADPKVGAPEGRRIIACGGATGTMLAPEAIAEVPLIAEASFKVEVRFEKERGAILIMSDPITTSMDTTLRVKAALKRDIFKKKKLAIVTEVTKCSEYAILVGEKGGSSASIQLSATAPIPAPGVEAGAGVMLHWSKENMTGSWRFSSDEVKGNRVYTPLIKLRMLAPRGVNAVDFRAALPKWPAAPPLYYPPWGELDTDGEEVPDDDDDGEDSGSNI